MASGGGDLIRRSGYLPATDRRTGRAVDRITREGVVEAHRLDVEAALYQRKQDHADLAVLERIHSAGILLSAAETVLAQNPRTAPFLASALQDWELATSRNYRRTFS